ncbi:hypothetical protein HDU84_004760 [Entophlyctis sp. JEL0112]|nr:hypothetical protein HDU84_004760 [Entophlyctis sp. JEL0112]
MNRLRGGKDVLNCRSAVESSLRNTSALPASAVPPSLVAAAPGSSRLQHVNPRIAGNDSGLIARLGSQVSKWKLTQMPTTADAVATGASDPDGDVDNNLNFDCDCVFVLFESAARVFCVPAAVIGSLPDSLLHDLFPDGTVICHSVQASPMLLPGIRDALDELPASRRRSLSAATLSLWLDPCSPLLGINTADDWRLLRVPEDHDLEADYFNWILGEVRATLKTLVVRQQKQLALLADSEHESVSAALGSGSIDVFGPSSHVLVKEFLEFFVIPELNSPAPAPQTTLQDSNASTIDNAKACGESDSKSTPPKRSADLKMVKSLKALLTGSKSRHTPAQFPGKKLPGLETPTNAANDAKSLQEVRLRCRNFLLAQTAITHDFKPSTPSSPVTTAARKALAKQPSTTFSTKSNSPTLRHVGSKPQVSTLLAPMTENIRPKSVLVETLGRRSGRRPATPVRGIEPYDVGGLEGSLETVGDDEAAVAAKVNSEMLATRPSRVTLRSVVASVAERHASTFKHDEFVCTLRRVAELRDDDVWGFRIADGARIDSCALVKATDLISDELDGIDDFSGEHDAMDQNSTSNSDANEANLMTQVTGSHQQGVIPTLLTVDGAVQQIRMGLPLRRAWWKPAQLQVTDDGKVEYLRKDGAVRGHLIKIWIRREWTVETVTIG